MSAIAKPDACILELKRVSKTFGGVKALQEVSFALQPQHILGLIGPNGAGKTTLFNLVTGIYAPDQGQIFFGGAAINGKKVQTLVKRGIARTFQNVELFESMSVIENVMVGQHVRTRNGFWAAVTRMPWAVKEERRSRQTAMELLAFVGLDHMAEVRSRELAFGWQRLVEIARALAAKPVLLLLDEPAAGLNAVETAQLGELIKRIQALGIAIILVEHDMSLTMEVSDRVVVLDQGCKIAEGSPRQVQQDEAVLAAYLGTCMTEVDKR